MLATGESDVVTYQQRFHGLWDCSLTDRGELSIKKGTLEVEIPGNRTDRGPRAAKRWSELPIHSISLVSSYRTDWTMTNTGRGLECAIELRQCMGISGAWGDALRLKPAVCRKGLEQRNDPLEECDSLGARWAAGREARPLQGAVASPMGSPLVLRNH